MTFHRREVLGTLGVAGAQGLLWAFGCGPAAPFMRRAPEVSGEVRTWLHDAVSRLAVLYPTVQALAVSRRRTVAARDVLGAGVARLRVEGAVFTVRSRDGWRDHVTSELTRDGIDAAARALGATRRTSSIDFGGAPTIPDEPPLLPDDQLLERVEPLLHDDAALAPRIIYAAGALDLDDAIVWSIAPGRDLEQRLVRIRKTALRAAGNAGRPVVRQAERAWSGWLDDQTLTPADLTATSEAALQVITPGGFDNGERAVVLDPSVVAVLLDAAVHALFTSTAARRPEIARRLAGAPPLASRLVTLVDDPTVHGAYGGFAFDDEGEPAAPITLLDAGRIAGVLTHRIDGGSGRPDVASSNDAASSHPDNPSGRTGGPGHTDGTSGRTSAAAGSTGIGSSRGRRPGHLGWAQPSPSHLVLVPGAADLANLLGDGFLLEGGLGATLDPTGTRIRISCTHAWELKGGNTTGKLYSDVELVGSLAALLSDVDAVASTPTTFAPRGPTDRDPLWRSISTPAIRTRGLVRATGTRA